MASSGIMHRERDWISIFTFIMLPFYVYCQSTGDIRLVDGGQPSRGRVEIFYGSSWGTVCDDSWGESDARVVCRQLGYPTTDVTAYTSAYFGRGSGFINLDEVSCTGFEYRLEDCLHDPWRSHNCEHGEDAGVDCGYSDSEGSIRLVGGLTPGEGRVEIYHQGQWGTVCDDGWGTSDAQVVCRQLGYETDGSVARSNAFYGRGSGDIYLDNVDCNGLESRLEFCDHSGWGIEDCSHSEDAGVSCPNVDPYPSVPATSPLVIGMMSFVGISLFFLTMIAIAAVYCTCKRAKVAMQPPSQSVPLQVMDSTTRERP